MHAHMRVHRNRPRTRTRAHVPTHSSSRVNSNVHVHTYIATTILSPHPWHACASRRTGTSTTTTSYDVLTTTQNNPPAAEAEPPPSPHESLLTLCGTPLQKKTTFPAQMQSWQWGPRVGEVKLLRASSKKHSTPTLVHLTTLKEPGKPTRYCWCTMLCVG